MAGFLSVWVAQGAAAQADPAAARAAIDAETLRHFQALVRMDTTSPPGNEKPAADYVAQVLEREGIPVQTFAVEAHRPNVVARLTGNGSKRPLLLMAHTDTVNVDPAKWQHPPFSAARDGGHIYGRGTVDDKDSVTAALMTMLLLKRNLVALDRDVIFLAEAGEEGDTEVGIEFMVEQHYDAIDAEYCLAEGGNATRVDGRGPLRRGADRGEVPEGHRPHRARRRGAWLRAAREQPDRAARARDQRASRSGSRPCV